MGRFSLFFHPKHRVTGYWFLRSVTHFVVYFFICSSRKTLLTFCIVYSGSVCSLSEINATSLTNLSQTCDGSLTWTWDKNSITGLLFIQDT